LGKQRASRATQAPHKRHPLDAPTDRAGSMSEPALVPPWPPRGGHPVATTASPRGHPVATTATVYLPNPIEDITIASNNGYNTISLNIIKLQSMYW